MARGCDVQVPVPRATDISGLRLNKYQHRYVIMVERALTFKASSQQRTQNSNHPSASTGHSKDQVLQAWKYFLLRLSLGTSYHTPPPSLLTSTRSGHPLPL